MYLIFVLFSLFSFQPESPLTPLYCNISLKSPVSWPTFLGEWAYCMEISKQGWYLNYKADIRVVHTTRYFCMLTQEGKHSNAFPSIHEGLDGDLVFKYKIQIPLFSIKHNTMFLAYIGKYTYNENMKKRRTYMCHLTRSNR